MLRVALELQHRRSTQPVAGGPLDADPSAWTRGVVERSVDAELYVIALRRFLRLAEWAAKAPFATPELTAAVEHFKAQCPDAKALRDIIEHFDEYTVGAGRLQREGKVQQSGWGLGLNRGGVYFTYGDLRLDAAAATEAARVVHRAIRAVVDPLADGDPHGGPETIIFPNP